MKAKKELFKMTNLTFLEQQRAKLEEIRVKYEARKSIVEFEGKQHIVDLISQQEFVLVGGKAYVKLGNDIKTKFFVITGIDDDDNCLGYDIPAFVYVRVGEAMKNDEFAVYAIPDGNNKNKYDEAQKIGTAKMIKRSGQK